MVTLSKKCDCTQILIVDDIAFNLLALELMFKKKFDIHPDKALSGEQAVQKVKEKLSNTCCKEYKLVLMDFYMPPGINGSEAARKIKSLCNSHIA